LSDQIGVRVVFVVAGIVAILAGVASAQEVFVDELDGNWPTEVILVSPTAYHVLTGHRECSYNSGVKGGNSAGALRPIQNARHGVDLLPALWRWRRAIVQTESIEAKTLCQFYES
jgi:hypothetical protein